MVCYKTLRKLTNLVLLYTGILVCHKLGQYFDDYK